MISFHTYVHPKPIIHLAFTHREKFVSFVKKINKNIHVNVHTHTYGIVAGGITVWVALNTELGTRSNVQRAA